ncbi:MAG: F-type H+-transporting ATPase subunit b [Alphaproteobacteria bacterium]|jgi:F-type H+-transporting ATPase subunit b
MPFDWFTIAAQIINFTILLWLLRRFLYRPILDGLDAREIRLNKILDEANSKNIDAEQRQNICQHKEAELEQQRSAILEKAHSEAKEKRIELFDSAQEAADEILRKRLESLQSVLLNLKHEVLSKNMDEVYATAGKMLDDLAGVKLEQAIVDKFLNQLKALQGKQYEALHGAMKDSNNILVRSAFALTDEYKHKIEHTLINVLSADKPVSVTLNFMLVPTLIAGLELSAGGWKLAWSIHSHMQNLQDRVSEVIQLAPLQRNGNSEPKDEQSKTTFAQ